MARAETPHKALRLTGGRMTVLRDIKPLQQPRLVNLIVGWETASPGM
jgi:hypothetical protein